MPPPPVPLLCDPKARALLEESCQRHGVPFGALAELLDVQRGYVGEARQVGRNAAFDAVFDAVTAAATACVCEWPTRCAGLRECTCLGCDAAPDDTPRVCVCACGGTKACPGCADCGVAPTSEAT